jgi:hypothetical protein
MEETVFQCGGGSVSRIYCHLVNEACIMYDNDEVIACVTISDQCASYNSEELMCQDRAQFEVSDASAGIGQSAAAMCGVDDCSAYGVPAIELPPPSNAPSANDSATSSATHVRIANGMLGYIVVVAVTIIATSSSSTMMAFEQWLVA